MLELESLTQQIIGAAIEVNKHLGPGLLESVYEICLCHELHLCGLKFARQVPLPVTYKNVRLETELRLDILVEDSVVVELKSVETVIPVHEAQLLTQLKLAKKKVGLLINFNVVLLKDGITRRVV